MAARAHLRLRFDKVALRVIGMLRSSLAENVLEGEAVLFTITAPIRLPSKTVAGIEHLAKSIPSCAKIEDVVHGNDVRLRRLRRVHAPSPRVIGFVLNPESDAELLFDLAEARLTGIERSERC